MLAPLGVVIIAAGWVRCVVTNVGPTLVQIVPVVVDGEVGQVRSRVDLFEHIRRDRRLEQLSIRELAERHGVHRRTVRQALAAALPPPRKTYPPRRKPAIDPYASVIDSWLIDDRDAPKKQRHTARRVWQRLVVEHGATLAEVTVSRYVAHRRVELGMGQREVSIPQTHLAGAEAEVDFGEFYSVLAGQKNVKVWMFAMRLSHSGKAFHVAFGNQAQEAFLEGHVLAFEYFGGVPGRLRYDNLKPAVVRVLKGRDRVESERFTALRSHYGFDSFFCRPGIEGAHEKGGVEGEIGRFRRNHLVPVPKAVSLAALNELIAAGDVIDDSRVITGRPITIGAAFTLEAPTLMPLPTEAFDAARLLDARVDNRARVSVRQTFYSVPARYAGRRLPVRLSARTVEIFDGSRVVAAHERSIGRFGEVLVLDHYLEVLKVKPGGLPGATALAQAKTRGAFTTSHQAYWDAARRARGDAAGTRALIEILLAHRTMTGAALTAAMDRAVTSGCLDPQVVLIDARRDTGQVAAVVPIGALTRYDRPAPTLADYDQLLTGTRT
jgi:transposase